MGLTIGLPSGIGDVAWALMKLHAVRDQISHVQVACGWPNRTQGLVELAGYEASYGQFDYPMILRNEQLNGVMQGNRLWSDVAKRGGNVLLQPNEWLENHGRIEEWMPDLPTAHRFPLYTTDDHRERAAKMLASLPRPLMGVSCASYRGYEEWRTWDRETWVDCLKRVMALGWQPVMLGAGWDDLSFEVAEELSLPNLVGKTHIGVTTEIMKSLDAHCGFSSGLNVLRVVVDRPQFGMWKDDHVRLSTSWVPEEDLRAGRSVATGWRDVDIVFPLLRDHLQVCLEERKERMNGEAEEGQETLQVSLAGSLG